MALPDYQQNLLDITHILILYSAVHLKMIPPISTIWRNCIAFILRHMYRKINVLSVRRMGKLYLQHFCRIRQKKKVEVEDYVKAGGLSLLFPVGLKKILNFFHISEDARADCDQKYPSAWYLEVLAVDGAMKGCGLGSGMLQDCLIPYIQKQGGQELTLITNTESNCKFYAKNGFREFSARTLEENGQRIGNWSFCLSI